MCLRKERQTHPFTMALQNAMWRGWSGYPGMQEPTLTAFGQSWNQGTPSAALPSPGFMPPTEDHMRDSVDFQYGSNEVQVYPGNVFMVPPHLSAKEPGSLWQGFTDEERHDDYMPLVFVRPREATYDQVGSPFIHLGAWNYLAMRNYDHKMFSPANYADFRDSLVWAGVCQKATPTAHVRTFTGGQKKVGAVIAIGGNQRTANIWQWNPFQLVRLFHF